MVGFVLYLGGLALLLSPAWRSPPPPEARPISIQSIPAGQTIGIVPLDVPKPLPGSLPSKSPASTQETVGGEAEAASGEVELPATESTSESTEPVPEKTEAPSGESGGGSEGKTILGIEG